MTGAFREGSDVDVAVITKNTDNIINTKIQVQLFGKVPAVYDVRIFELLPIKIKVSVMNSYTVLFGDKLEISEYLYYYRKMWDDCKYRIDAGYYENFKEQIGAIQRFERIKKRSEFITH